MSILKESWQLLTKPNSITLKEGYDNVTHSVITMEPFENGFGNTLGNSLRRVLLSSIAGFAVTSIKIDGVMHEYSSIDGVKEDVMDIIMNVKSLAITKGDSESFSMKLQTNKAGPVYASSIKAPAGVDIINKDLLICTLNENSEINIVFNVDCSKGYSSLENSTNAKLESEIGVIYIDAVFSPVKRVSCKVDNSRVGKFTNYDKLIIEIETNGSISPRDALAVASKILQDQFESFINFDSSSYETQKEEDKSKEVEFDFNRNLLKTIEELELSVRSYNCLKNENIIYVGDLVTRTESDMLKTANFGRKSLNELKDNLKSMSLSFGMKLANWPPKNLEELLKLKNKEF